MVQCLQCKREFDAMNAEERMASISGSIMGDEYIETYYLCRQCGVYTLEIYHDRFLGDEDVCIRGPLSKAEGDSKVELIGQCETPYDKHCRCKAHVAYFGAFLD